MNEIRNWTPDATDVLIPIEEWEECVNDGLFIDYDGFGYFCNPETGLELWGFDVFPSMIGTPAFEERKVEWTHINWFNR